MGDYFGFRTVIESTLESALTATDLAKLQAKAQEDATKVITDYNKRIGA